MLGSSPCKYKRRVERNLPVECRNDRERAPELICELFMFSILPAYETSKSRRTPQSFPTVGSWRWKVSRSWNRDSKRRLRWFFSSPMTMGDTEAPRWQAQGKEQGQKGHQEITSGQPKIFLKDAQKTR